LASEGDETAGRGERRFGGVCGLDRFMDDSAISAGVESTNLRFLDDGGVGTGPPDRGGAAGVTDVVLHLDQGGGGGTCGLVAPITRSVINPFTGGGL